MASHLPHQPLTEIEPAQGTPCLEADATLEDMQRLFGGVPLSEVLTPWLGEQGDQPTPESALLACGEFDVHLSTANALRRGFERIATKKVGGKDIGWLS